MFSQEDSKKMFIEFCRNYLLRAMRNSKQMCIRKERKKINECMLKERNAYGNEYANLIVGDLDVDMDQFLKFPENIEDRDLYFSIQKLSDVEKDVVAYRLDGYRLVEINRLMKFKRNTTAGEVYNRAIRKMRKSMLNNLNIRKGGQENEK